MDIYEGITTLDYEAASAIENQEYDVALRAYDDAIKLVGTTDMFQLHSE